MSVIIPDGETAARLEDLARKQAFYRFQQQIMFSLIVWLIDEDVRDNCVSPVEWLRDCILLLERMV